MPKVKHDFDEREMDNAFNGLNNNLEKAVESLNESFGKKYTHKIERSDDFCNLYVLEGEHIVFNYNGDRKSVV